MYISTDGVVGHIELNWTDKLPTMDMRSKSLASATAREDNAISRKITGSVLRGTHTRSNDQWSEMHRDMQP
jgi:hypothetical protein